MARRRTRSKRRPAMGRVIALVLVLTLAVGLAAGTRVYMAHTGADALTALRQTIRLGGQFVGNLLSPASRSVPLNPYRETDFYSRGGFLQCAASEVSRVGIDVSSHQQDIDWGAVAEAGVEFAIVRVGYRGYTDGDIFADANAIENIGGALAAGLDVGVYFFSQATSAEEAREEARFVLDAIAGCPIRYPVLFDWENILSEARTDDVTGPEMTEFARAFCDEIASAGYIPGVYFNQSYGYNSFDLRQLRDCEFWLAEYDRTQSFAYEVQLWQYDCEARIPGIETTVDLNLCYRDYLEEVPK